MLDPCVSQGWLPTRNMSVMVHTFSVALTCWAICMQQQRGCTSQSHCMLPIPCLLALWCASVRRVCLLPKPRQGSACTHGCWQTAV